jgi:hypothetical protein
MQGMKEYARIQEKAFVIEKRQMLLKQEIEYKTPDCRSEAISIQNIRNQLADMAIETPVVSAHENKQVEKMDEKKPSKAVVLMKEVWERIKAAGKALIRPEEKSGFYQTNISPRYVLLAEEKLQEDPEEMPEPTVGEMAADFVIAVINRLVEAGKALFKPKQNQPISTNHAS